MQIDQISRVLDSLVGSKPTWRGSRDRFIDAVGRDHDIGGVHYQGSRQQKAKYDLILANQIAGSGTIRNAGYHVRVFTYGVIISRFNRNGVNIRPRDVVGEGLAWDNPGRYANVEDAA